MLDLPCGMPPMAALLRRIPQGKDPGFWINKKKSLFLLNRVSSDQYPVSIQFLARDCNKKLESDFMILFELND